MENKTYILNQETGKIELHFTKPEYLALSEEQKKELKSAYLFSGKQQAWVSRSTKDHYWAIKTAEKLGFTEKEVTGERLSFAEQVERQTEKAQDRAEKYEQYANNAEKKAESLQSELNHFHGDIAFFTQPNINSSSGRTFTNYRNKVFARYQKGLDEYRKSDYFKDKALTAEQTASGEKFKDKVYLENKIKECNSNIKQYEANIVSAEESENDERIKYWVDKEEWEIDKLAYLENCLDAVGGITYDNTNIKPGYAVKIRGSWDVVVKANRTTVETKSQFGSVIKYNYSEIQEVKVPENFKEIEKKLNTIENPYVTGDILTLNRMGDNSIYRAFQVIKTTEKSVTIQEINLDKNIPMRDCFKIDSKPERKGIVKSKYSDYIGAYYDDWQLNKHTEQNEEKAV